MDNDLMQSVVKAGLLIGQVRTDHGGRPFVIIPEGTKVHDLEHLLPTPTRKRATITFHEAVGFIRYVNEHKGPSTRIFSNRTCAAALSFTAVLDFHEPGAGIAQWCEHRAIFALRHTEEWKLWTGKNEAVFTQREFAQFVEDNLRDITRGAEMLDVAETLRAKTTVNFKCGVRLDNGNEQLSYEETTTAKAGVKGALEVPREFSLFFPVFNGEGREVLWTRLRHRVEEGRLTFYYELMRPQALVDNAFDEVSKKIATATSIEPFAGEFAK